tara:strand:+ start:43 stop:168 length:126 start_codon:yes stop_codon:yes gene_type:complete
VISWQARHKLSRILDQGGFLVIHMQQVVKPQAGLGGNRQKS